jgi:hypothetical protein
MRLDMQREAEQMKRKGFARRTILAVIWLAICTVVAYFLVEWLLEIELISINFFYRRLQVPSTVDEIFIRIGLIILIVLIMQFFVLVGYAFFSPVGRRRPGDASPRSPDPDPFDDRYDFR